MLSRRKTLHNMKGESSDNDIMITKKFKMDAMWLS